jgi:hypothetical protein
VNAVRLPSGRVVRLGALGLALILGACATKPEAIKITAATSRSLTLKGSGTAQVRLEIHQVKDNANAVAWMTWTGENPAVVTSSLTLYRFDTSKPNVLHNVEKELDLEIGKDGSVSTNTVTESRRLCASFGFTLSGFDVDGNEVIKTDAAQVCEKS